MNPWLEIPLEEYEAHMSMASVAQAQFLSQLFARRVRELHPKSIAIVGCAGGNGFERLRSNQVDRIVGIDINPRFVAATRERYANLFNQLELLCGDFLSLSENPEPVEFVHAGLVFEYVDFTKGLASIIRFVKPGGNLSVVLQLPSEVIGPVSPTPYVNLNKLEGMFKFVPCDKFETEARSIGLSVLRSERSTLKSGKSFHEFLFKRDQW